MKRPYLLLFLALATGGALTACSADAPAPSAEESASTPAEEVPAEDGGSDENSSGAGSDAGVVDPGPPLVEQTYKVPGSKDEVSVAVHSLTVDGDIMELLLTFTPDYGDASASRITIYEMVGTNAHWPEPLLVDRTNLKEYRAVDSTDFLAARTDNQVPILWRGWYAAPEDDIDTVDIRVVDGIPEFTDVPITR